MGNTKRERKVYKNTKEESRQLHDLLNCIQEEKTNRSKVQKEQLNARFMSFYNSSNTWDRSKKGSLVDRLNAVDALRSGKAPSFAAVGNSRWSRMARSAVSPNNKAEFERAQRAVKAIWLQSNANPLALSNAWDEWKRDVRVKLERAQFDKDSIVMWKDRNVSITTREQLRRGDVMLTRRVPAIYVEARCSQIAELPETTDVRVLFETTQFDHERSVTMWRELVRDSSAFNNVFKQLETATANIRVVSEGGGRDVEFRIAMWGESNLDFNSAWERLKRASVVSTSSNSEKSIVEVTLHQGVSILVEGFLFEANTNLPQNNNNTILNNSGNHGNLREWVHLYTRNYDETYNNDGIHNVLKGLSLNTHLLPNNNKIILNSDKSCDSSERSCLDLLSQITGVAPDCSVTSAQRGFEQITLLSRHVTRHTNSHQLREHFK